jgi:hypothetical protein
MGARIRDKQIRQALARAAKALAEREDGQKGAAAAAGVKQQSISAAIVRESGGWDLLCGLAQAFDQTIDDLLQEYGGYPEGRVAFRVGNLPGWLQAVEAAQQHDPDVPEGIWALAGDVRIPFRPNAATPKLAAACAAAVVESGKISGFREKLRIPVETPR